MATTQLLEVSELAAEKFQDILKEDGDGDGLLRVMVMPGSQGGIQYMLSVEAEAGEDDFVIDTHEIQVLVDADSAPLLDGSTIDYMEGLMRSGFVISNPNLQGGCGCGGGGGGWLRMRRRRWRRMWMRRWWRRMRMWRPLSYTAT